MSRAALRQIAVARPRAEAEPSVTVRTAAPPLRLIRGGRAAASVVRPGEEVTEASLLDFDPDEDLASLVPMPRSIPRPIRRALIQAFERRFEFYEELDRWLHAPHDALAGATPFERIVRGDGMTVLRALGDPRALERRAQDHTRGQPRDEAQGQGGRNGRVRPMRGARR